MNDFWRFDSSAFKDATTLILLNDPKETTKIDLELKNLIVDQFKDKSDLSLWIINNYDKVLPPYYIQSTYNFC